MTPHSDRLVRSASRTLFLLCLLGGGVKPASAFLDDADRYVEALNDPEKRQELGLERAERPEDIANRLDVTFEPRVPPERRAESLQRLAQEFLRVLFERESIPTVTVVERGASGGILNRVTSRVEGVALPGVQSGGGLGAMGGHGDD